MRRLAVAGPRVLCLGGCRDPEPGVAHPATRARLARHGLGKGLVVTAAGHNDRRAWFRPGRGTGISLAAYGSASAACQIRPDCGIFSTFPDNLTTIETECGACRASFQGSRRPGMDNTRVLRIIKRTASGRRFRNSLGWGILNAGRALTRATR